MKNTTAPIKKGLRFFLFLIAYSKYPRGIPKQINTFIIKLIKMGTASMFPPAFILSMS